MSYKVFRITAGFALCFLLTTVKSLAFNSPLDSIGIEKQGNKTFILHKVDPKETLFSLSRRYQVKVDQIQAENPELKEGLKEGQVLRIPYKATTTTAQKAGSEKSANTHQVAAGQTLYSISRMYKVSVNDLRKWNNLTSNELSLGQEIVVAAPNETKSAPQQVKQVVEEKPIQEDLAAVPNFRYDSKGNKIHTTGQGQTLYSIAQIYDVSVEDLKKWNTLSSNEISAGQEIVVAKSQSKETTPAQPANLQEEKNVLPIAARENNPGRDSSRQTQNVNVPAPPVKQSESSAGFNKVVTRGLAEAIAESGDNPKFLALHKTASVGTIIQVKNELNNLYIFARVIGKLPETSENDKLVVKLSKKAYDKLGAVDKRFPVEVSYVPND